MSAHQNAPTQCAATGETINPSHRILIIESIELQKLKRPVKIACRAMFNHHERAFNLSQPEANLRYDSGETHASYSCPKQFSVFITRTGHGPSVSGDELKLCYILTESPGPMMIFTVHICGNAAPKRHVLSSRSDRWKPTEWPECPQNLINGCASFSH